MSMRMFFGHHVPLRPSLLMASGEFRESGGQSEYPRRIESLMNDMLLINYIFIKYIIVNYDGSW